MFFFFGLFAWNYPTVRHSEWISPNPSELCRIIISLLFVVSSAVSLAKPIVITEEWNIPPHITTLSAVRLEQFTSHQIFAPRHDFRAAPENCQGDDRPHVNSWTWGKMCGKPMSSSRGRCWCVFQARIALPEPAGLNAHVLTQALLALLLCKLLKSKAYIRHAWSCTHKND